MNEQVDRAKQPKDEAFIRSIYNRLVGNGEIEGKSWVNDAVMYNQELKTEEDDYANTLLVVTTKEGYEIFVDFNNSMLSASIQEDNYQIGQYSIVNYDSNTGTGNVDSQRMYTGDLCTLASNTFSKENYNFVGWCKDKDGNGEIYPEGTELKITEDITLYAIWEQIAFTVTFDANGGTGTMESLKVEKNVAGTLPANTVTKSGLEFSKWNTKSDGTGTSYWDCASITVNEDITLYAMWSEPVYIYNQGSIAAYPLVSKSYSSTIISLKTNYIYYSSATNSYLYCSTAIPNNYSTLHVNIKAKTKGYSWSSCSVGVRPTYDSDGSSNFSNWFIPGDWYKSKTAASSTANDNVYRDCAVDLTGISASSYYFFLHTAGQTWYINKIWLE